jgi:hypothetical protein
MTELGEPSSRAHFVHMIAKVPEIEYVIEPLDNANFYQSRG